MKKLICSTLALVLFATVEASPLTKREAQLCRYVKTANSQQDSWEVRVQKTYCSQFGTRAAWFPTPPKLSSETTLHAAFCGSFGALTGPVFQTNENRDIAVSYLRFAEQEGKPKIIIFGSGRIYDDGDYLYAAAYKDPNNYLLVDCDPRVQPDIVADINLIQAQDFGPELYDSVINEHVGASFDRLTLFGVMSLLRIGGQYVSPLLPRLRPEGKHRPDVAMNRPYRIFHFGTGTCYLQDGDLSDVYVDRKTYKTYANTPLAFFNCCAAYFGEYCGLDPTKFKIEFKTVKPGSAEWPHLYDTVRKDVMVVTRLK